MQNERTELELAALKPDWKAGIVAHELRLLFCDREIERMGRLASGCLIHQKGVSNCSVLQQSTIADEVYAGVET
jgi:hypothetical protein